MSGIPSLMYRSQSKVPNQVTRWLIDSGLGRYCEQFVSLGVGEDRFRNIKPQEFENYGVVNVDDKRKLHELLKQLNARDGIGREQSFFSRPTQLYGQSRSGRIPASATSGMFDMHGMDDMELLTDGLDEPIDDFQRIIQRPSSPSQGPQMARSATPPRGGPLNSTSVPASPEMQGKVPQMDSVAANEADLYFKSLPKPGKIKVVVRKRPLNKKEKLRKEDDVISIMNPQMLTVNEPKVKVDLTAFVEKHDFVFDAVLNEFVTNDEVYRETVEPIVPTIFNKTRATCFAYGQTGSGKTYTMQPLPLRAAEDMLKMLELPYYKASRFELWISFFEIYGGKLYDLLNDRQKLNMREDGRQQVCIVGLKEVPVIMVETVHELVSKGNASRSTGSTGANEESSRSHAILQMTIKQQRDPDKGPIRRPRRSMGFMEAEKEPQGKVIGKFSFIDLAGSERGADTTDNDKQTRMEGAEINKSLLALKECIRALDMESSHIPFRGSKLTEVLRDSFVGNSKTVMISCVSPGSYSVEHTLNTLRYADRVKSLSKSGVKKEPQMPVPPPTLRDLPPGLFNLQLLQGHPNASQIEAFVEAALAATGSDKLGRGLSQNADTPSSSGELLDYDHGKDRLGRPPMFDSSKWGSSFSSRASENPPSRSSAKALEEAMEVDVAHEKISFPLERDAASNHALLTLDDNAPSALESRQANLFEGGSSNCGMAVEDESKVKAVGKPPKYLRRTSSVSSMPPSAVDNPSASQSLNGDKVDSEDEQSIASADTKKGIPEALDPGSVPKDLPRRRQPPRRAKGTKSSRSSALVETFDDLVAASSQDNSSMTQSTSEDVASVIKAHETLLAEAMASSQQEQILLQQLKSGQLSFNDYSIQVLGLFGGKLSAIGKLQADISRLQIAYKG